MILILRMWFQMQCISISYLSFHAPDQMFPAAQNKRAYLKKALFSRKYMCQTGSLTLCNNHTSLSPSLSVSLSLSLSVSLSPPLFVSLFVSHSVSLLPSLAVSLSPSLSLSLSLPLSASASLFLYHSTPIFCLIWSLAVLTDVQSSACSLDLFQCQHLNHPPTHSSLPYPALPSSLSLTTHPTPSPTPGVFLAEPRMSKE